MLGRIETDHRRFRQIVHGTIRRDLKKYVSQSELLGRSAGGPVAIPVPQIDLPHFTFGDDSGGVGRGEGDEGGAGEAGEAEGQHVLEVEIGLDELARILGEELELPDIRPRGEADIVSEHARWSGIRRVGPESLRHFRRTYREALKRQIASGLWDPAHPVVVPVREDRRYRSSQVRRRPESRAVIIHMMDVSGSMGTEQKEIVRIEAFWIDTWLRHQYKALETVYIVHDAVAREVSQHDFYHLRESGGTKISAAYQLCADIMRTRYGGGDWNIYPFHFSDGDNWSSKDTATCVESLRSVLLPQSNLFCYGQVRSAYGSGQFKRDLDQALGGEERLVTSAIADRDGILASIRDFLGKGR